MIETMSNPAAPGVQVPVLISFSGANLSKVFTIDKGLNPLTVEEAVAKLWDEFFLFLSSNLPSHTGSTVFIHNLGGFVH